MSDETESDGKTEPKEPVDDLVVTHHTLLTTSGEISYTARTGRVVLREEELDKKDVFKGWKAHAYFPTGHMPYLHEESRVTESEGIAAFVTGA